MVHTGLGDTDHAFELLDRAIDEREPFLPQIATFPPFRPLADDPRMGRLLQRVGLRP